MNHGSHPKSRLSSVTFARELLCLDRVGSMVNITSQWQYHEILISCYRSILQKIMSHAETPCAQILLWHIRPFQGYRRETGPREAETDSSRNPPDMSCHPHHGPGAQNRHRLRIYHALFQMMVSCKTWFCALALVHEVVLFSLWNTSMWSFTLRCMTVQMNVADRPQALWTYHHQINIFGRECDRFLKSRVQGTNGHTFKFIIGRNEHQK